jgi:hypothetical protein
MIKTTVAAAAAAGFAVLGVAGSAMAQGVDAGDLSLANIDASDAAQWQVCGQNVLAQPGGQDCDNSGSEAGGSGVDGGALSLVNADASDAAHWQICGQNVIAQPDGQDCDNADGADSGSGSGSDLSLVNGDGSDAAHWQICGQNVLSQLDGGCDNGDGPDKPSKGDDQGDF